MDKEPSAPPAATQQVAAQTGKPIPWRKLLTGALVAGAVFGLFAVLAPVWIGLVWMAGAVFFPVALWVGRESFRPWRDGFLYGSFAGLLASLVLLFLGFLPAWALGLSFLLAWPQGMAGTWLGKRLAGRVGRVPGRNAQGS
jgi:hypothetical protein